MSARARAWVAARADAVPAQLVAVMRDAVDQVPGEELELPHALAEAALYCLRHALHDCDDRSAALPLLAADALMTSACEAAAHGDSEKITLLAETCTPQRLARLLSTSGSHT
jgi:hypothetical protein